jgi:hypothetical protein
MNGLADEVKRGVAAAGWRKGNPRDLLCPNFVHIGAIDARVPRNATAQTRNWVALLSRQP